MPSQRQTEGNLYEQKYHGPPFSNSHQKAPSCSLQTGALAHGHPQVLDNDSAPSHLTNPGIGASWRRTGPVPRSEVRLG